MSGDSRQSGQTPTTRSGLRMAKVQFGGITREACLEYVPETQIGEYVLVHVGFAISRVDEAEAERTYQALKDLDQLTRAGLARRRGDSTRRTRRP